MVPTTSINSLMDIDGFDDIENIIEALPEPVRNAIEKLRGAHRIFKIFMGLLPQKWRGTIAGLEGRQVVTALKLAEKTTGNNWDNEITRTAVKNILIGLYDLEENWLPTWPLEPDVTELEPSTGELNPDVTEGP